MANFNNASITYFDNENEADTLVYMYDKAYKLSLDNENITLIFINLTGDLDTLTIDDLSIKINYNSYSEYIDYSLIELEDQISLLYNEFYRKGIYYDPVVIIIHDANKMPDCADEYELLDYLNDKLALLKVLNLYIFCTVRH